MKIKVKCSSRKHNKAEFDESCRVNTHWQRKSYLPNMSEICSHASFSQWNPWSVSREEPFWAFTHDDGGWSHRWGGVSSVPEEFQVPCSLKGSKDGGKRKKEVSTCFQLWRAQSPPCVGWVAHWWSNFSTLIKTKTTGKTCFLCHKSQRSRDPDKIFNFSSEQQVLSQYLTHLSLPPAWGFHSSGGGEEEEACWDKNKSRWNQIHMFLQPEGSWNTSR